MERNDLSDLRWEYRCWPGEDELDRLGKAFGLGEDTRRESRCDIYLLVPGRTADLIKLRGQTLLEWKHRAAAQGRLEMWGYRLRCAFPLPEDLPAPPGHRVEGRESPTELMERAEADPGLEVVAVQKQRRLFELGEVTGEITRAEWRGHTEWTLGFESPTWQSLEKVLERAPDYQFPNTDYGRAILGRLRETAA